MDDEAQRAPRAGGTWDRLRPHLTAIFVTFHLLCVAVYLIPIPPHMDARALNHPDVKEEVDRAVRILARVTGHTGSHQSLRKTVVEGIRRYAETVNVARHLAVIYLERVGSSQSWNMFGGTPPRHPRVLMVEVRPSGSQDFALYQDGHWLTPADNAWHFRHRKLHEQLSLGGRRLEMQWYARYWARRWNAEHPGRPAGAVRLSWAELNTPDIATVRGGRPGKPEKRVNAFVWEASPEESP